VPVLPAPPVGPRLDVEIRRRIRNHPQSVREDRLYRNRRFWYDFLSWEHTACRHTTRHQDFQPWEAHDVAESPPPPDEEDKDYENYHVIKEEAMQDVPPGAGDLPEEYQALVAGGYDEESLLQQALEASKADEDEVCPGYNEVIKLTGLVATHWPRCHHHHSRRMRGRLPTTRGRRCRRRPEFRAASIADEGMTNGPPIFAYLVFGPGKVSLERLSRPIKAMV
jgi:hypothetical protein